MVMFPIHMLPRLNLYRPALMTFVCLWVLTCAWLRDAVMGGVLHGKDKLPLTTACHGRRLSVAETVYQDLPKRHPWGDGAYVTTDDVHVLGHTCVGASVTAPVAVTNLTSKWLNCAVRVRTREEGNADGDASRGSSNKPVFEVPSEFLLGPHITQSLFCKYTPRQAVRYFT